jgi:hypothetical protein
MRSARSFVLAEDGIEGIYDGFRIGFGMGSRNHAGQ